MRSFATQVLWAVVLTPFVFGLGATTVRPPLALMTIYGAVPQQREAARPKSVLDGVFTADQATRGGEMFQSACASCHTVADQTGRRFVGRWRASSVGAVFDLISGTMPDGNPGSLTPGEYAAIVAFYLKETGYPEGPLELPATLEQLLKIEIQPPH